MAGGARWPRCTWWIVPRVRHPGLRLSTCIQADTPSGGAQRLSIVLCTKRSPVQLLPPLFEVCAHPSWLVGTGTMQGGITSESRSWSESLLVVLLTAHGCFKSPLGCVSSLFWGVLYKQLFAGKFHQCQSPLPLQNSVSLGPSQSWAQISLKIRT